MTTNASCGGDSGGGPIRADQLDPLWEVEPPGQGHGVPFTTRSGELRMCSTGSGRWACRGPNGYGQTPGRKSQISARAPGRRANAMDPRLRLHLDALALARAFDAMRRLPFYCGLF